MDAKWTVKNGKREKTGKYFNRWIGENMGLIAKINLTVSTFHSPSQQMSRDAMGHPLSNFHGLTSIYNDNNKIIIIYNTSVIG